MLALEGFWPVRTLRRPWAALFLSISTMLTWLWLGGGVGLAAGKGEGLERIPPRPLREFRGAWIATVANLDWPSKPGLTVAQQQSELLALFDKAVQLKLNVLILQVRPSCDAFYASDFEPWSEFLSGQMGKGPEPFYDPLSFAVREAHLRGLELHAWFNPFRVRTPNPKTGAATNYITQIRPQWVRSYGSQQWLDPGLKEVRDYSIKIIRDVVRRYDIDGVHLDDYFYPYPEKDSRGGLLEFPDETSWRSYQAAGGRLSKNDWRRRNVDNFVELLYQQIKAEKRWVKVGISPFGIWRPGNPRQIKGLDAYEHLFADSKKWLNLGWADYFAPQLYWSVEPAERSYPALLEWWASQNSKARHLWPGNDATKVGSTWPSSEIVKQVRLTRKQAGATGNVLWNMSSLMRNNGRLTDSLAKELYTQPALVPASPWLEERIPAKPKLRLDVSGTSSASHVAWSNTGPETVWLWLVQTRLKGKWSSIIVPGARTTSPTPSRHSPQFPEMIAVTGLGRCGSAGPTAVLDLKETKAPLADAKQQVSSSK